VTNYRATLAFLAVLSAVAVFFCYLLAAPFLKPIAFSFLLAIMFYPVHARMRRWIPNRNVAAFLSTSVVIFFISLAAVLLGRAIVSGLVDIYQSLANPQSGKESSASISLVWLNARSARSIGIFPLQFPTCGAPSPARRKR